MTNFSKTSYVSYFARVLFSTACVLTLAPKAVTFGLQVVLFLFYTVMLVSNHFLSIGDAHITKVTKSGFLSIDTDDLLKEELEDIDNRYNYQKNRIKFAAKEILRTSTLPNWNMFVSSIASKKVMAKVEVIANCKSDIEKLDTLILAYEKLSEDTALRVLTSNALNAFTDLKNSWDLYTSIDLSEIPKGNFRLFTQVGVYDSRDCRVAKATKYMKLLNSLLNEVDSEALIKAELFKLKQLREVLVSELKIFKSDECKCSSLYRCYVDLLMSYIENSVDRKASTVWRL